MRSTLRKLPFELDPEKRKRALLDQRLRSPEMWVEEAKDMDSLTTAKALKHKSKSRALPPLSPTQLADGLRRGMEAKLRGNMVEARLLLHPVAHAGNAEAQVRYCALIARA